MGAQSSYLKPISEMPSWADAKRICIDAETNDPQLLTLGPGWRRGAYIAGVSFAIEDGPAYYLPVRHEGGGNYPDSRQVFSYLRHQAKAFKGDLVGCNLPYDLDGLANEHVEFSPNSFRDLQISGPVLDRPNSNDVPNLMSLDKQCERAGVAGKDEAEIYQFALDHFGFTKTKDVKGNMWRMPAHVVAEYAIQDVLAPLKVLRKHERQIEEEGFWDLYMLENKILPILLKMRRRGVRIDFDQLDRVAIKVKSNYEEACKEVTRLSGVLVTVSDLNKKPQLEKALASEGVKCPRLKDGKPQITSPWLKSLNSPVAKAIVTAKAAHKVETTYVEAMRRHAIGDRVHGTLNQLKGSTDANGNKGAAFGRLSGTDPNLQNQPIRLGAEWRRVFLPDEGGKWACMDFAAQEPRLVLHYAEITGCPGARAAADMCRTDPDWDSHGMMAGMIWNDYQQQAYVDGCKKTAAMRKRAKKIYLGKMYGMGEAKLCHDLGLPTVWKIESWSNGLEVERAGPEGKVLLSAFQAGVPYLGALDKKAKRNAKEFGVIKTLLNRQCRFPIGQSGYDWVFRALNRLIQGSAADQMKQAMVDLDAAGFDMQLQVHDEVDTTVAAEQECYDMAEIMCNAVQITVPTKVDIEWGDTWGDIASI